MSDRKANHIALLSSVALAVLLALPVTSAAEETLLVRLPLALDGNVHAAVIDGSLQIGAADSSLPRMDMVLTAAEARVLINNHSQTEVHNAPAPLADVTNDPQGGFTQLDPNGIYGAQFLVDDLTNQFELFFMDGAIGSAEYVVHAVESPARLDLQRGETLLSYTATPRTSDFAHRLEANAFKLSGPSTRYEIRGDFTFALHGATLTTITADEVYRPVQTGTWTQTTGVYQGPLSQTTQTTTTTQWVLAELKDAVLTLEVTGGEQGMYAHTGNIAIDVDGTIRSGAAAGSISFENETVRNSGEGFSAKGQFRLTPTYVVADSDRKEVLFGIDGQFQSLSVGPRTYTRDPAVVAAAVGAGSLLAGLGLAYAWKTGILLPLYAKLTKAKVLDQTTRQQVHSKVESHPGCQVKEIADALDVSWTTASYHLRVLRKMDLVIAKRTGRHEHFFATGSRAAASHAVVSALHNPTARQIVQVVLLHPGIIQKDLCAELGIAASTASGHLAKLRDIGALSEEREWKKRRYYAGHALRSLPIQLPGLDVGHQTTAEQGIVGSA